MSTTIPDRNIWLIYGAILVLGLAYGISLALTALQLDAAGFGKHEIGTLATIFASGIVLLSLPMGRVIGVLSAKTTLVACLLVYAACVSAFPFQTRYASVGALRFFDGASSVGIWVSCETILLSRAAPERKALVMSLYAMAMALGYLGGAVIAKGIYAVTGSMPDAFLTSGAIALIAALMVLLRLDRDAPVRTPQTHEQPAFETTTESILRRIKTSCFAAFSYGYFQASVVLFLPLFLIEQKGIPKAYTILVPAIFSFGMLVFTSYAGRLGDRFGQLRLMRLLAAVGTAMILGFVLLSTWTPMCIAIFVAGASLASISPLSLALQGRSVEPRDYGRATALYNTFYAGGMLLGPPISSFIFERRGGEAMLIHLALLWASFVLFASWFAKDDPAAVHGDAVHGEVLPDVRVGD